MVKLQYKTFLHQTICSVLVYVPALVFCLFTVSGNKEWAYDSNVILDNTEFNSLVAVIIFSGFLSLLLAIRPNWTDFCR